MSIADRVVAYLRRHHDYPPTASEIAAALNLTPSTVGAALKRMAAAGTVRKLGVSATGARTWTTAGEG